MDDAESSLPKENARKIGLLENQIEKLSNDVVTLKGFVQVQDSNLQDCKK